MNDHARLLTHAADTISAAAIVGAFFGWLPPLAALMASLWYLLQIYESDTVQTWLYKRKVMKRFKARHFRRILKRHTESTHGHATSH